MFAAKMSLHGWFTEPLMQRSGCEGHVHLKWVIELIGMARAIGSEGQDWYFISTSLGTA
jgi:hypothetical protein